MKIIADEKIPLVQDYFGKNNELILKPGRTLSHDDVKEADMLLVRSVTRVNETLLKDTAVKFVGSVSAGIDHLDIEWLNKKNIMWRAAQGSNAAAVAQYVLCVIAALQKMKLLAEKNLRAGVIGVGFVGKEVVEKLKMLGIEVFQNDPFRADAEKDFISTSLEKFNEFDLILLHTPLTRDGKYPTHHLIDKNFLKKQKKHSVLLNAGRGAVIDSDALKKYGKHLVCCLDVWENEPNIDREILNFATIATPHIAGHTIQAKNRATKMIFDAAVNAGFGVKCKFNVKNIYSGMTLDPVFVTEEFKKFPEEFDRLREKFGKRDEFKFVKQ